LQAANQHSDNLFTLTCHRTGDGSGDIVCGRDAQVSGQDSSAQGTGALANGTGANAYGANTQAVGDGATAIGNSAIAEGVSTTALGDHAEAAAPNSTALGENSAALGVESTAIGYGSVANRPNSVSVGNAAAGIDRQITNVAAGTQPHDAVNLQQFQDGLQGANAEADKVGSVDASLGEAAAQAAAGMGNNTVSGAVADYNGQSSFAFSYQHRFGYHWTGDVTVASNGGAGNTVAAAGAGYSW
jgi:autotransporter adhesin